MTAENSAVRDRSKLHKKNLLFKIENIYFIFNYVT